MSAKTKIVVLRLKELVFTGIVVIVVILLLILLLTLFLPKKGQTENSVDVMTYIPGVYTSSVLLNDTAVDVQVIVDEENINSISLVNLDETVETMYPLVKPTMDELSKQIIESQSLENITYSQSNQYTSIVLLNAIKNALEKGMVAK